MLLSCGVGEDLRVPWTARGSNQSILKQICSESSLEGLMLQLKLQYFGHLLHRAAHWRRPWCWERLKAGGEGDGRDWDGWMASSAPWTWVWASSGRYWRIGKPGVLPSMGSQRVGHGRTAEPQQKLLTQAEWTPKPRPILLAARWGLITVSFISYCWQGLYLAGPVENTLIWAAGHLINREQKEEEIVKAERRTHRLQVTESAVSGCRGFQGKAPQNSSCPRDLHRQHHYWLVNLRGSLWIKQVLIKTSKPQDLVLWAYVLYGTKKSRDWRLLYVMWVPGESCSLFSLIYQDKPGRANLLCIYLHKKSRGLLGKNSS